MAVGPEAGQWVTYAILLIITIVYLALVLLLISKIIEGITRIVGGVGFDRSRHTVDSGLIGVCSLLGCCGSRKRPSPRQRAKHTDLPRIASQTTLPLTSRKGSTPAQSQSGPPSIFRPEHALRPYREENDHDTGYIMGAWRPFPRPGYSPVGDHGTPPESPANPKPGFSRVGGGRSHFDTPYSIATGSVHTFPSASMELPQTPQRYSQDSNPSVTPSFAHAERQAYSNFPPGAAIPPTVRRKSQCAVIEHAPVPPKIATVPPQTRGPRPPTTTLPSSFHRHSHLAEMVSPISDDDASEVVNQSTKKRHWFQLRKPRRHSDGDEARPGDVSTSPTTNNKTEEAGRSFVVIRGRNDSQPVQSGARSGGGEPSDAPPPTRSFVVLRGKDNPLRDSNV